MAFNSQQKIRRCFFVFFTIFLVCIIYSKNTYSQALNNETVETEKSNLLTDNLNGNNLNNSNNEDEISNSDYGFIELWNQGDLVAKLTLIILFVMSLGTWTLFFIKYFEQIKINSQCMNCFKFLNSSSSLLEVKKHLRDDSIFMSFVNEGFMARKQSLVVGNSINESDWVINCIENNLYEIEIKLQNGLTFLATVGSTAPFVGLFGTVWAIYHALIAIGLAGEASLDKVAGPVGEALVMTAIGLAVAVPAVLGYNWLVRRNKTTMKSISKLTNKFFILIMSEKI